MRLPGRRDVACQELVELATPYLEGTMGRRERARVERHLAGCDGCQAYVEQMRATLRLVGRVEVEAVPEETRAALLTAFRAATRSG